jgi:hypothetical protein
METYRSFRFLHEKLRTKVFKQLGICDLAADFFYDPRLYAWVRMILDHSAEEVLFACARAYHAPMTTGILRFGLPLEALSDGAAVLWNASDDVESRYRRAQMILSGNEDRIQWRKTIEIT